MASWEYNWPLKEKCLIRKINRDIICIQIIKLPFLHQNVRKLTFSMGYLLEIMLVFNVEVYKRKKHRNNVFINSPRIHTVHALRSLGLCNYFERSFLFCVIKEEFLALSGYSTIWPCRHQAYRKKCADWLLVFEEHSDLCWVTPLDLEESDPQVTFQLFVCLSLISI